MQIMSEPVKKKPTIQSLMKESLLWKKEALINKKKYDQLLMKHKQIVNTLKTKLLTVLKTEKSEKDRYRRELDDLRHQADTERAQKITLQSQINAHTDKRKTPSIDFDALGSGGNISSEQMQKFREALESQLKQYSDMLALAEARATKCEIELSKKEKTNQALMLQMKKVEDKMKDTQFMSIKSENTLKQYKSLYDEIKLELVGKDEKFREIANKKEDEIIELKKQVRIHLNEVENLEHQVHAFDTIKIEMEVDHIVNKAKSLLEKKDLQELINVLEELKRIRYQLRRFDRSVEEKFVNLGLELERSESSILKILVEDPEAA